jgi:hypothetical protein
MADPALTTRATRKGLLLCVGGAITSNYWDVSQILSSTLVFRSIRTQRWRPCFEASTLRWSIRNEQTRSCFYPQSFAVEPVHDSVVQGTRELFSYWSKEAEMRGLKPRTPNHCLLRGVACGGLRPRSVILNRKSYTLRILWEKSSYWKNNKIQDFFAGTTPSL